MKTLTAIAVLVLALAAYAGDFRVGTLAPGADGGTSAQVSVTPNSQFMVSCTGQVNYRVCTIPLADAGTLCLATGTDAPIAVGQVDLCNPTGYNTLGLGISDGGSASCGVFHTTPKTVCQINSP